MRYAYPYELLPQPEGGFTVVFPDVPEAITQGDSKEEAAAMAEDALVSALSFYTDRAAPLPPPVVCAACHEHLTAPPLIPHLRFDLHRHKRGSTIRSRPLCWRCLIPAIALRRGGCWLHLDILHHGTASNGLIGRILRLGLIPRNRPRSKG